MPVEKNRDVDFRFFERTNFANPRLYGKARFCEEEKHNISTSCLKPIIGKRAGKSKEEKAFSKKVRPDGGARQGIKGEVPFEVRKRAEPLSCAGGYLLR